MPVVPALPPAAVHKPARALVLRGEYWEITYEGRSAIVENCRGLRYIGLLIEDARLDRGPVHAKELVARATGRSVSHAPARTPDTPAVEDAPPDLASGPINLRDIKEWAGREAQKRVILELQKRTNISQQELARMLGVDPKTLRSRLKEISADTSRD